MVSAVFHTPRPLESSHAASAPAAHAHTPTAPATQAVKLAPSPQGPRWDVSAWPPQVVPPLLGLLLLIGLWHLAASGGEGQFPTPGATWSAALETACRRVEAYDPDVLVVSLGVDTYKEDPISQFRLDSPDYLRIGARIAGLRKPTLFVMEGGYAVEAIGINVANTLEGFLQA